MKNNLFLKLTLAVTGMAIVSGIAGCGGKYGSLQRDLRIANAFETNQLEQHYKYLYNGHHNTTYAIVGIDPAYRLESKFWRAVEPNTEEFQKLTNRMWEDYGFRTYAASILDPTGNKIGVFYSSIYVVTVKFVGDNEIQVLLDTPYLWGPEGGGLASGPRTPF